MIGNKLRFNKEIHFFASVDRSHSAFVCHVKRKQLIVLWLALAAQFRPARGFEFLLDCCHPVSITQLKHDPQTLHTPIIPIRMALTATDTKRKPLKVLWHFRVLNFQHFRHFNATVGVYCSVCGSHRQSLTANRHTEYRLLYLLFSKCATRFRGMRWKPICGPYVESTGCRDLCAHWHSVECGECVVLFVIQLLLCYCLTHRRDSVQDYLSKRLVDGRCGEPFTYRMRSTIMPVDT